MPLYGRLIVIKRNGTDGAQFPLQNTSCVIGRSEVCDIRVQLPTVSGEHCRLDVNHQLEVYLTNLSSVNPTILKQSEVKNIVKLEHKDCFTVSDRSFRFEYPPMSTYRIDSPSNLAKPLSPLKTPFKLEKIASPASNKKQTATAVTSLVKKQVADSACPSSQGTKTPRRSSSSTINQSFLLSTPGYDKNVHLSVSSLKTTPNMSTKRQQKIATNMSAEKLKKSAPDMSITKSPSSTPKVSAKKKQEFTPNIQERIESTSNMSSKKKEVSTPMTSAKKRQSSLPDISDKERLSSTTDMSAKKRPNSSPDNPQSLKKKQKSTLAGTGSFLKNVLTSEEVWRRDSSNSGLKSLNNNKNSVEKSKTTKRSRSLLIQHQSKSDVVTKRRSLSISSRPVNKTQSLDQGTAPTKKSQPTKRAKSLLVPQEEKTTDNSKRRSLSAVSRPNIVKPVSRQVVKTPKSIIVNVKTPKSTKNNVKTPKSTKNSSPKNLQIEFSPKNLFTPKVSMSFGSVKKAVKFSATPESVRKSASLSVTSRSAKTTPVSGRKKRPLWSEIAKSGIVKKGLGGAKSFTTIKSTKQVSKPSKAKTHTPKTIRNKAENPAIGKVSTTGHINSPLPLVIHKKVTKTPKPLPRKGRKIAATSSKDVNVQDIDLSGLESLFVSPKVGVRSTAIRKLSTSRDVSASPSFTSPKNKRASIATPKSASRNALGANFKSKEFLPTDQSSMVSESQLIDTPLKAAESSTKKIPQPRTPKTRVNRRSSVLSSPSTAVLNSLSNSPKDTKRGSKSLNTTPKSASKQYLDNSALSEASPIPPTHDSPKIPPIKGVSNSAKQRRSTTPRRPVSSEPVDSAKNSSKVQLVNSNVNQSSVAVTPAHHTAADLNKMLAQRAIYGKIATPKLPVDDTSDRFASKENMKKTPKSIGIKLARKPASSLKKKRLAGPPLWSEVAKSGIAKKGVAKKIITDELKPIKRVLKTTENLSFPSNQEDMTRYDMPTTGHANSPLPVVIHRKQLKTPKPLPRKGRKGTHIASTKVQLDNIDYDGLENMFKTPKRVSNIYKSLPPTPQGPGIMHVSPLSSAKQSRTSNIINAFLSDQNASRLSVKRLSSAKSSPKLSQAQDLLKSSPNLNSSVTPKPGNKSFRKTRTPSVNQENLSSNLQLARKIFDKTAVSTPDFVGIKEMFAKSNNCQSPLLFGVREMLKTPKAHSSPNLKNLKDLFIQHSGLSSPNVDGLAELFKSPLLAKSVELKKSASPKVTKRNRRVPNKYLGFSSPMIDKILTPKRKSFEKTPVLKSSESEVQSKEHLNNTPSIKRKPQNIGSNSKKLKLSNELLSNENVSETVQVAKSHISPKSLTTAARIRSKSGSATPNLKSPKKTPRHTRGRPRVSSTLKPKPSPFKKETKNSMLSPKVTVLAVSPKPTRRGRTAKKTIVVSPQKITKVSSNMKPSPLKNRKSSSKVAVAPVSPKIARRGRVGKKTVIASPQKITKVSSTLKTNPSPFKGTRKDTMFSSKTTISAVSPKTTRRGRAGKKTVQVSPTRKSKPSPFNNKTKNNIRSPKVTVDAFSPKATRRGRAGKKTVVVSPQKITEVSSTPKPNLSPQKSARKDSMFSPKVSVDAVSPKTTRRGRAGKKTATVSPQKIAEVLPTRKLKPSLLNNKTKNNIQSSNVTVNTFSPKATRRGRAGKKTVTLSSPKITEVSLTPSSLNNNTKKSLLSPKISVAAVSPKNARRGRAGKKSVIVSSPKVPEVSSALKTKTSHFNIETKSNMISPNGAVTLVTPKITRRGRASKKTAVSSPQKVPKISSSPTLKRARGGRKAVGTVDTNSLGVSPITEKTKSSRAKSKRIAHVDSLSTVAMQIESLNPVNVPSPKPLRRRGRAAKNSESLSVTKTVKQTVTSRTAPKIEPLETSLVISPKTVRRSRLTKLDSALKLVSELKTTKSAKNSASSLKKTSDSLVTRLSSASPKVTRRGRAATKHVSIQDEGSSLKRKREQTPKQGKVSKSLKTPSPRRTRSTRK